MSGETEDYVWHFKLLETGPGQSEEAALTEMVQQQIAALLRCLTFTCDGRDVRVTGFRLLEDPAREHLIPSALEDDSSESI